MKRKLLVYLFFCSPYAVQGQEHDKQAALDFLFQNIPIYNGYNQVFNYLDSSTAIITDSIKNKHLVYLHMAAGKPRTFFSDTTTLHMLLNTIVYTDSSRQPIDTAIILSITTFLPATEDYLQLRNALFKKAAKLLNRHYQYSLEYPVYTNHGSRQKEHKHSLGIAYRLKQFDNYSQVTLIRGYSAARDEWYLTLQYAHRSLYQVQAPRINISVRSY